MNSERFKAILKERGVSKTFVAGAIGITKATLNNRINRGSSFSYAEVLRFQEALRLTDSERDEIFLK